MTIYRFAGLALRSPHTRQIAQAMNKARAAPSDSVSNRLVASRPIGGGREALVPDHLPCRIVVGLSACLVASLAWTGRAEAQDTSAPAPAPAPAAVAPVPAAPAAPEAKSEDADSDKLAPNSIFAEGLGAAIAYSINYERMVIDQLGVRVGFSYLSIGSSASAGGTSSSASATYIFVPVTASYVGIRSGRSALELGAGVTMLYVSGSANAAGVATSGAGVVPYGVAMIGYRNQPVGHAGFMFRIGANALVAPGLGLQNPNPGSLGVIPWPYISLGASF
jgi:hypothetical protein